MAWHFEGPEPQRPWGAQRPETAPPDPPSQHGQPRWSWRKSAMALLVAAGIAAGGGVAVYAASGTTGTDGRGPGVGPPGYGPVDGGPWGGLGDGGPIARGGPDGAGNLLDALHGEFVVSDGAGGAGYVTKLMQVGELTEAGEASITVRSVDGFTQIYALDADTARADVQTGDTVRVIATRSGDTVTADSVTSGARPTPPTQ